MTADATAAADWDAAIRRVLSPDGAVDVALQPIIDLQRASVTGHEMLARFPGPPHVGPDRWFAAAEQRGLGGALAARTVQRGLALLDGLPDNTFLTINVEPQHLHDEAVRDAFGARPRLDRLFVELTEHAVVERPDDLGAELDALCERGARVAVDDAGAGYAGLSMLLALRPQLVKLDRSLIAGLDRDPAKRVLVRAMGELAATFDAWVLAEGIETERELAELVALDVPLGQGYLFGRPAPGFTPEVPAEVLLTIADRRRRGEYAELAVSLLEDVPLVADDDPGAAEPAGELRVVVDGHTRPVALDTGEQIRSAPLLAKPSEPLAVVARRAVARGHGRWDEPVVLTDGRGVAVGVVTVDRMLEHLARRTSAPDG